MFILVEVMFVAERLVAVASWPVIVFTASVVIVALVVETEPVVRTPPTVKGPLTAALPPTTKLAMLVVANTAPPVTVSAAILEVTRVV